jgi:hypothetical protein
VATKLVNGVPAGTETVIVVPEIVPLTAGEINPKAVMAFADVDGKFELVGFLQPMRTPKPKTNAIRKTNFIILFLIFINTVRTALLAL